MPRLTALPRHTRRCWSVADFGPVTCAGCGLLCDDVTVERSDDVVRLDPACPLGAEWFRRRIVRPAGEPIATIDGRPADIAELLRGARRPLLYGFDGATVEDARAAVALADRLGALIATNRVSSPWPGAPAVPLRGASTATLGELRDRSGLLVIWREDPETTHPRLLERLGYGTGRASRAGAERTLIVVDDRDTATTERSELQLSWAPERDLEALTTLHALQRSLALRPSDLEAHLGALLERIRGAPHVAFVYGSGLDTGAGGQRRVLALHEMVWSLSRQRHVVTLELPRAPGTRSANDVLAWQTGYAESVDLAGGHPELLAATQPLAEGEGIDVALCVEGTSARLAAGVARIALRCLSAGPDPGGSDTGVSIRTAAAGVEAAGTAHRLDGVPLALQAPLGGDAPTAAALLRRLLAEVGR
jgi:formylmethanofuran dehydrogenase subunit B